MAQKIARWVIALLGALLGPGTVSLVNMILGAFGKFPILNNMAWAISIYSASAIIFGIIFFIIAPSIITLFSSLVKKIEMQLNEIPFIDLIGASLGLVLGLFIAFLLSGLVNQIPIVGIGTAISVFLYVLLGWLGWTIAIKRRAEIRLPTAFAKKEREPKNKGSKHSSTSGCQSKILDTSVIIDGRIFDICKTGIIEGTIVIPNFVLNELRHIADSADGLKRNRGRRGLDILNKIQRELDIPVIVENKDYDDIAEVDAKLLRLALDTDGMVVTNDYNLNKVAAVQGVNVFNINELANAVKPVVLPGEEMDVRIIKDGKEFGQGVAYLDDGTMIVVDNGKKYMNEMLTVVVTSVLQTAAGRMIFAKLKAEPK